MHHVLQVVSNARRSEVTHVRSHRNLAVQVPHLSARLQQTDQSQKPPTASFRSVELFECYNMVDNFLSTARMAEHTQ